MASKRAVRSPFARKTTGIRKKVTKRKTTAVPTVNASDLDDLERAYESELAKKNAYIASLEKKSEQQYVADYAMKLATKMSTEPEAVLPHIERRLGYQRANGKDIIFFKDVNGNRTMSSQKEFEEDFRKTPFLKRWLKQSEASGSDVTQKQVSPLEAAEVKKTVHPTAAHPNQNSFQPTNTPPPAWTKNIAAAGRPPGMEMLNDNEYAVQKARINQKRYNLSDY